MDEQERERWRGSVDADLRNVKANVATLFRLHSQTDDDLHRLELKHTALAVKVGAVACIGSIIGSGLMTFLLSLIKH
jgi:hypothetical protein